MSLYLSFVLPDQTQRLPSPLDPYFVSLGVGMTVTACQDGRMTSPDSLCIRWRTKNRDSFLANVSFLFRWAGLTFDYFRLTGLSHEQHWKKGEHGVFKSPPEAAFRRFLQSLYQSSWLYNLETLNFKKPFLVPTASKKSLVTSCLTFHFLCIYFLLTLIQKNWIIQNNKISYLKTGKSSNFS